MCGCIKITDGTILGATTISAPGSTKHATAKRNPEVHHAANVADTLALPHLLHGKETRSD